MRASGFNMLLASMLLVFGYACIFCANASAEEFLVTNQKEYAQAVKGLEAGDTVVLSNGVWRDFEIVFTGEGKKGRPITLTAQEKGKVILSGKSNLRLAGEHLVVSGLVFRDGYSPSSEVVAFRRNKRHLANHSRVTEVVIEDFSKPERMESDYWVSLYGKNNRFDHNHLAGKLNKGVTLAVRLDSPQSLENRHRIDHNYFGPRPILGSNGGETLRIGTSHYSLSDSLTLVEKNYFDRCNGEVEIISVKSGGNRILNNTYYESRGTLTLRHGNGNLVEGNVFFGNGVDHTGGIRVINRDQIVRNNYLENLTGYRFGSGFTIMNGVPNSPVNRYHQVVNAQIENNSFINVEHIDLAAGSDKERSAPPLDSVINSNLFFNQSRKSPFTVFDDISGISFTANVSNGFQDKVIESGIAPKVRAVKRAENGLLYPVGDGVSQAGIAPDLEPLAKGETGVDWYPKAEPEVPFGSGRAISIRPGEDAIFDALKSARNGDTLLLEDGKYNARKRLQVEKTITLRAKNPGKAELTGQRPVLIEIGNGGSLEIDGLVLSGTESPDSAGNTLIRTSKWGMLENYRFSLRNSLVENLNVNHSFHFFEAGSRSFATKITIEGNTFRNISGDLFRLDKEQDDLGIYNAEYLTIDNNHFENIDGALVSLYRGGTDESTFGPHFTFVDNSVSSSGNGKRNKAAALMRLHGVQVTKIEGNRFSDSSGILVEHTVGEPITKIARNQFAKTSLPRIAELIAQGPHTAILADNKVR